MRGEVFNLADKLSQLDETRWLLYCDSSYQFLLSFLALLLARKEVVICANISPLWLEKVAESFDAVISDVSLFVEGKKAVKPSQPNVDIDSVGNSASQFLPLTGEESIRFFTSGSTGKPKAIDKKLACLLNEVEQLEESFGSLLDKTVIISTVSHCHIYGLLFKLIWPFVSERSWLEETLEYQEQIAQMCNKLNSLDKPCQLSLISSPAFLARLDKQIKIDSLACIFSSGGPLAFNDSQLANQLFGCLPIEVYGSTETGGIGYRQAVSPSQPWTLFDDSQLVSSEEETWFFSKHLTLNEKVCLDDKVSLLESNRFILEGRKDRVIKIEEKRVSLTEIEEFLESFEWIERCIALPVSGKRKVIGCVVKLSEVGEEKYEGTNFRELCRLLKSNMRKRFEAVTIPRKWRKVDTFPINRQGKVIYDSLHELFLVQD
ncbi:AMP-binding protein [Aliikangiella sp. G2MR2-5]|uniref:AMP-binding protein n=1 Tax=Aliikangiella sp. G2MR2-5 TaxID=2788943 RepID=UPI0018A93B2E|nr:AMP-binding protein [Aliikangiella sp. G2MR2-5]